MNSEVEIEASGVSFSYGDHAVLHDIDLSVRSGVRLGIIGESGSGKSTLAQLLVGLLNTRVGEIRVNGSPWSKVRPSSNVRRAVQMIHQDPFASLTSHLTALSTVREAFQVCQGISRGDARERALDALAAVGLAQRQANRLPRQLSGGQCQRVAIARALAAGPSLIVADEPTSALDLSVQAQIINLLLDVMSTGDTGLVIVSHDLAVVRHLTDEIVVMESGRIVERGRTDEVLANPSHPYTRQLCLHAL